LTERQEQTPFQVEWPSQCLVVANEKPTGTHFAKLCTGAATWVDKEISVQ